MTVSGKQALPAAAGRAPDYVRRIAPYRAGKPAEELAREQGLDPSRIVKLASNENPLGIPESARRAMADTVAGLARYPDANGFELKAAISHHYGVPINRITLGNGSSDILDLVARAFLQPGSSAVYSQYSFAVYALATQSTGARAIVVPARDYGHDLDAMAEAIDPTTRVVFVANPNNPTGTFLSSAELEAFLVRVPSDVIVLLDEAYLEYLPPLMRFDSTQWLERFPNLVISHTFSKAYGLAGLRVGFGLAQPDVTDMVNRVRSPFNVNSLALTAATAALDDEAFLQRSYEINHSGLHHLQSAFADMGLPYIPSHGNFVLVKVGNAGEFYEKLLRSGVIVRPVANYGLPEWLRVSVGLPEENEIFLQALASALRR